MLISDRKTYFIIKEPDRQPRRLVNMDRHIMLGHLNKLHIIKEIA